MGSYSLLQKIFSTQGSNLARSALQADALSSEPPGEPLFFKRYYKKKKAEEGQEGSVGSGYVGGPLLPGSHPESL